MNAFFTRIPPPPPPRPPHALLLLGHEVVDGLSLFELLLHGDEEVDAVDDELDQLHFGESQTIGVGDVESASDGGRVHAASSALLESQVLENLKMEGKYLFIRIELSQSVGFTTDKEK